LLVSQNVWVDDDGLHTASYQYRLATGPEKDDWLVRWEYFRREPRANYDYPLSHVHVRCAGPLVPGGTVALGRLHIATGRMALEHVIWHLIADWKVASKSADWKPILRQEIERFEQRRNVP
jgi:hypothetical protein